MVGDEVLIYGVYSVWFMGYKKLRTFGVDEKGA